MSPRPKRLLRTIHGALFGKQMYVPNADARRGYKSTIPPLRAICLPRVNFIEVSKHLQTMDRVILTLCQGLGIEGIPLLIVEQFLPPWEQECIHNEFEPRSKRIRCHVRDLYARSSSSMRAFSSSIETHFTSHTSFLFRFKSTRVVIKRM